MLSLALIKEMLSLIQESLAELGFEAESESTSELRRAVENRETPWTAMLTDAYIRSARSGDHEYLTVDLDILDGPQAGEKVKWHLRSDYFTGGIFRKTEEFKILLGAAGLDIKDPGSVEEIIDRLKEAHPRVLIRVMIESGFTVPHIVGAPGPHPYR